MTTLEGRPWRLAAWVDGDGARAVVPEGVEATATFEAGVVTGRGGCNRFRGAYSLDGDRLRLGPLAGTMMACPEPAMRVEAGFHAALARVVTARVTEDRLELSDASGSPILDLVAAPVTPMVGTAWSATGINNGRGGVVSVVDGTTVTATFDADGRIAGAGGCNGYTGGYRLDGSTLAIGELASTLRACLDPEGVMDQEAAYLVALGRSTRWAVDGRRLELAGRGRGVPGGLRVGARRGRRSGPVGREEPAGGRPPVRSLCALAATGGRMVGQASAGWGVVTGSPGASPDMNQRAETRRGSSRRARRQGRSSLPAPRPASARQISA